MAPLKPIAGEWAGCLSFPVLPRALSSSRWLFDPRSEVDSLILVLKIILILAILHREFGVALDVLNRAKWLQKNGTAPEHRGKCEERPNRGGPRARNNGAAPDGVWETLCGPWTGAGKRGLDTLAGCGVRHDRRQSETLRACSGGSWVMSV
ncbi:hypothetical protein EX30DRAFT_348734 [Ascodesmis nigricans]|uniref:Uncharacterized protein n=1 Tax=Ascodesmis nigricans TaxID=341454 RepID=A0A4S2MX59_9PEZI|nr:hypothetical protein EX30DRAFT_348734 [Ascodesmis nigricans]